MPVALLFLTNRLLNPALVPIEVVLNAYVLWVNRGSLPNVWRRMLPIVVALAPGVIVGTMLVSMVNSDWLKFITYVALLPLILLQAAGFRRPIQSERSAGVAFGAGLGVLYSVTTISGPPLAVALSNQGLAKQEFRAALGFIRLAESSMTAAAYCAYAGLYSRGSMMLDSADPAEPGDWRSARRAAHSPSSPRDVPADLYELRRVDCRLRAVGRAAPAAPGWQRPARTVFGAVVLIDICLLYRFFTAPRVEAAPEAVMIVGGRQPAADS